jgi:5-oxopent-3-ene-1,2,5-tricarboxylate decarboxylase/2-hydroxyhepta-2,4-diene-1,7-dioate isomerase
VKTARIAWAGAIHTVTASDGSLRLGDGQLVSEAQVVWLPPVEAGTVFAVGLNYADHAQELAFRPQTEPLVFLKSASALAGHRARTPRPVGVKLMHYECELAVVIGRTARNVPRREALGYVAGYTVANDYAVRDYLENYYRPNLRVKNRDSATVLGPWLVDAADVPDPMALELCTRVNGRVTQRGNTAGMIFDIGTLIEYLSAFMTLSSGDVILTGTPEGVINVDPGDEVVTEIAGIGSLTSYIVEEPRQAAAQGEAAWAS